MLKNLSTLPYFGLYYFIYIFILYISYYNFVPLQDIELLFYWCKNVIPPHPIDKKENEGKYTRKTGLVEERGD